MSGTGGRQTVVNVQPAPAVAGDFASNNPDRYSVLFGQGAAVAGPSGCYVGRFCWQVPPDDSNGFPGSINNFGSGPVTGFVAREQQGLNTVYLADASMLIPEGFEVSPYSGGDFWVTNSGTGQAVPGMYAYANLTNGLVTFAASGSATTASGSTSSIAAETFSVTGSITGNILTVTNVGSGTVYPGAVISGTNVTTGNSIVSQISGTTGGVGTYYVNYAEQSVSSETISGTYGLLTIGGTVTGTITLGGLVGGSGVTAGTYLTAFGTGTGGAGTYIVNLTQTVSSESITVTTNVQTKWICMSSGLANEVVKISSQPLG